MSVFIVSDKHISAMLQMAKSPFRGSKFSYYFDGERKETSNRQKLGQILLSENYRSVNFRYNEGKEARDFIYQSTQQRSPVEIISLCDCYQYQTCETDDWKDTEAFAIWYALRENAIESLPGYGQADWSI